MINDILINELEYLIEEMQRKYPDKTQTAAKILRLHIMKIERDKR